MTPTLSILTTTFLFFPNYLPPVKLMFCQSQELFLQFHGTQAHMLTRALVSRRPPVVPTTYAKFRGAPLKYFIVR
jgi:hypothetical protein